MLAQLAQLELPLRCRPRAPLGNGMRGVGAGVRAILIAAIASLSTPSYSLDEAAGLSSAPASGGIAAMHADLKFSVLSAPRAATSESDDKLLMLERQIQRIAAPLETAARGLFPVVMQRINAFEPYVARAEQIETRSSATGKIAINHGLGRLAPTDDWMAFVLAREMGHVLAGHHESNSTASIVTSVIMNLLLPGSSLIKSAISAASSEIAASSNAPQQVREADEIAVRLLETAGYDLRAVALSLATGPSAAQMGEGAWSDKLGESSAQLIAKARPAAPPLVAASGPAPVALPVTAVASMASIPAVRMPAVDEPLIRQRPSGVAGPLMLGGYLVPPRRVE